MTVRPRRSLLYMPGSNSRALDKARSLAADGLIFDLEEAVAPSAKVVARQQVMATLEQGGYGQRELIVRVNGFDTPWAMDDIQIMADAGADAILLPKVEGPDQVQELIALLDVSGASRNLPVWVMIETPRGVLNVDAIAGSHARLGALVVGTSDLAKDTRARHTLDRRGLVTALSLCVLAARAHGLDVLDGVQLDLADEQAFRAVCEQGRDLGFDGKTLIHPKQIVLANEIFAPSAEEIAEAEAIIQAWQEAEAKSQAVVVVNDRLVENLHVEEARRILALARAIARAIADNQAASS